MTKTDRDALRALEANERVWQAPWVAHTFEIDCPCPNGEHCGDTHTCEEVESPEAYPEGQCVVQISVPGLETFAGPTAQFIAASRNALVSLLDAADERDALAERVRVLEDGLRPFVEESYDEVVFELLVGAGLDVAAVEARALLEGKG